MKDKVSIIIEAISSAFIIELTNYEGAILYMLLIISLKLSSLLGGKE